MMRRRNNPNVSSDDETEQNSPVDSSPGKRRNVARKSTGGSQASTSSLADRTTRLSVSNPTRVSSTSKAAPLNDSDDPDRTTRLSVSSPRRVSSTSKAAPSNDSDEDDWDLSLALGQKENPENSSESESSSEESGSESPDSDEERVLDKSLKKPKKKKAKPSTKKQKVQIPKKTASTSQKTKSSAKKVVVPQSKDVLESLVNKCVYYMLVADQKKYLIRRQGIIDHVFKDQTYNSALVKEVILRAGKVLEKTFGFELLCDKDQKDAYMIVNILKPELKVLEFSEHSDLKTKQRGLILYLLTIIFMNECPMHEDEVWKALKPLGIDATSRKPHPDFGDVKKYVCIELVKQMYLHCEVVNKDPPMVELSWGKRAVQEVDKRDLLNFVCKVMNTQAEDFVLPYQEAKESARQV